MPSDPPPPATVPEKTRGEQVVEWSIRATPHTIYLYSDETNHYDTDIAALGARDGECLANGLRRWLTRLVDRELSAATVENARLREALSEAATIAETWGTPGPGGVDITGRIPSEIYIGIGRERYDDQYAVAQDVAESVCAGIAASIRAKIQALAAGAGDAKPDDPKTTNP